MSNSCCGNGEEVKSVSPAMKMEAKNDASVPIIMREIQQSSPAGRSVVDYTNLSDLRQALETVSIVDPDWKLPVPDPEAEEENVDVELRRLWTLKSYLLLDADCEEAFDELTSEARRHFNVPTCAISLVDLGRQFMLSSADEPAPAASASASASPGTSTDDDGEQEPPCRETPRSVAFCAHTILSKRGLCVVPDTKEDDRFKHNKLVTDPPFLRFYAGAPLLSPEGYKLGTFCVEGPEPRPGGLTPEEEAKLQEYASRAMRLMVQRRQTIHERLMAPIQENLRRHAAVTNNLGRELFGLGECVSAMQLFQESVQTLMFVGGDDGDEGKSAGSASFSSAANVSLPTADRQEEMAQILKLLTLESSTDEGRKALVDRVKFLVGGSKAAVMSKSSPSASCCSSSESAVKAPFKESCVAYMADASGQTGSCQRPCRSDIPGLFSGKRLLAFRRPPTLAFSEAFQISVDKKAGEVDYREFIIPVEQCSKATLFNMGLVHYHWGSPDTAMHFFDLAASLSKAPLAFDPVVLGCLNNMAQINLMYGKALDSMELLADAVTRGNAALSAMYASCCGTRCDSKDDCCSSPSREQEDFKSRRLRRKLARTVMNMGHVHFYACDYDASMKTCEDAIRLLRTTNFEDEEAAAAWYNIGVLHHHKGDRARALEYLGKFIDRAIELAAPSYQVADALHLKGQVMFEVGNLYECMKPLNEALRMRQDSLGDKHSDVAESLCMIGKVLQAREEYDFALNALEGGLSIMRSQPTGDDLSLDVAQTMLEVGRAYHIKGNLKEALRVYNEVADVARKFFGDRHEYVARIFTIIAKVHAEVGDIDESVRLFQDAMKMCLEQGVPVDMNVIGDPILGSKRPLGDNVAPPA